MFTRQRNLSFIFSVNKDWGIEAFTWNRDLGIYFQSWNRDLNFIFSGNMDFEGFILTVIQKKIA